MTGTPPPSPATARSDGSCPCFSKTVAFGGTEAGAAVLDALAFLRRHDVERPRANARLVAYHAELPLARMWGGGEVASVDGLRFVVPCPASTPGATPSATGSPAEA